MYLKSLELFGFKSFPDRTLLNFDTGTAVVVGPNGSGKSNISDAMRWVLGEVSSRNIRGTRMEDVIFGGTDDRKQMNFAEVSVTFDNEDRQIDIAFDEVTVTRRYYRKGESEYFINRKPVRLRDIHELFMNTGVGREGYSIIGQGRIAEIISQKSEERRAIFEEAAGISKYRYKKEEAENKLKAVDDNLTRVADILSELEGRVEPLARESERARKYLEYYEIKKRDDISLWLYHSDRLAVELKAAEERFILSKNENEIAEEALQTLENRNERLFEVSQEIKYRCEQLRSRIDEAVGRAHELDNSIKLTENDIAHRKARLEEQETSGERLQSQKAEHQRQLEACENNLADCRKVVTDIAALLTSLETEAENTGIQRCELARQLDEQLEIKKKAEEKIVELKIRRSVLDTTEKNDQDKTASLEAEIGRCEDSTKLLSDRAAKAEKVVADYRGKEGQLKDKTEKLSGELEALKKEKQDIIDRSNSLYLEYTAKKQRIENNRRMDELFEGYAQSVRFIMNEYEAGHIDGTTRINTPDASGGRIWGPVSRLIQVGARYTLAIETALGANIQNIIVDDEPTAKAAIRHLKQKNAGRATFYPIAAMKPRYSPIPEEECKRYAGYLGTADKVIDFDERFGGIIRNLLGGTLIFDNIDNGAAMAKATGYRVRVVTLDGQVINAGGSFTGGSAKRDSGMLTRRTENEKLKNDVAEMAKTIEGLKEQQNACDRRAAEKSKEISAVSAQISMLNSLMNAENTQAQVIKSQLESEERMLTSLRADLERIRTNASERSDTLARLEEEEKQYRQTADTADQARQTGASELGRLDEKLEELENAKSDQRIRRAEAIKDVEAAERELSERQAQLDACLADIESGDALKESLLEANREAGEKLKNDRESLASIAGEQEKLENERKEASAESLEYERRLTELRGQIREATNKKELCFRDFTLAETKKRSLGEEQDKLVSALWDDYELTYSGAKACGYPAVTEENRTAVQAELNEYKSKLKHLGSVNLSAIDEYTEVKNRFDFMTAQVEDLRQSKDNLLDIIDKLEGEMRETFSSAFAEIDRHFRIVFRELFGGGDAELSLTNPLDVLTSGIEIRVAPPGKIIKSLTLLSGGEQAFVAIAIIFAILRVNPTPFCIFDEIEAALDEANVFRFADYLKRYSDKTQFIVITHRRGTMEIADRIWGVTMQERGISKVLALEVGQVEESLGGDKLE